MKNVASSDLTSSPKCNLRSYTMHRKSLGSQNCRRGFLNLILKTYIVDIEAGLSRLFPGDLTKLSSDFVVEPIVFGMENNDGSDLKVND